MDSEQGGEREREGEGRGERERERERERGGGGGRVRGREREKKVCSYLVIDNSVFSHVTGLTVLVDSMTHSTQLEHDTEHIVQRTIVHTCWY